MNFEEFERVVGESFNQLPQEFRDIVVKNNIQLIPRARVPKPARGKSIVFGIFFGIPLGEEQGFSFEPTRIELYKESFDEAFTNPEEMKRQITITVIHEIAHYFGFSEKQLRKLGY